jgi:glucose-1-phosphate cytidylyltransferase
MKIIILAGGYGTRISEESQIKPKPMVEIGNKPILWHIMKIYSYYGFNDFIICLGYKGNIIKEYFDHYFLNEADIMFDFSLGVKQIKVLPGKTIEPWKVTLIDTGLNTLTGGRIKRIKHLINNETFMVTYGDGVSDININSLLEFHKSHKKTITLTAVKPLPRFGAIVLDKNIVKTFREKSEQDEQWVSAGFFVMEPKIFEYLQDDYTVLEATPLEQLSLKGEVMAYKHTGFFYPMDKLSDKIYLENLWQTGKAPWKLWKELNE